MKHAVAAAAVIATIAFSVSPASAKMMMCSGAHLTKMTTMVGGMPDGPHKWEMYKHLAMVNTAMSKDGMRGCEKTMKNMHRMHHGHHGHHGHDGHHGHHGHHMKHGKKM